jgi:hypothetical protein
MMEGAWSGGGRGEMGRTGTQGGTAVKRINRREWFGAASLLAASGCAAFAKRPPTPAKDLPPVGLEKAPPGEHYYVIVFGSQSTPKLPRFTHTWATVAHAVEEADGTPRLKEHHTISWLPASLNIQPLYLHPVQAVNLGLHETIEYVQGNTERVSEWGPYECLPRIYLRFLVQKEFLETYAIGYQAWDTVGEAARTGDGCDCIHAITDMDPVYSRSRYPLAWLGEAASERLLIRLSEGRALYHPEQPDDWLDGALGLERYPIIHRPSPS